jgi:hypothetical protein
VKRAAVEKSKNADRLKIFVILGNNLPPGDEVLA